MWIYILGIYGYRYSVPLPPPSLPLLLLFSFLHQEGKITGFNVTTNMVELQLLSRPKGTDFYN